MLTDCIRLRHRESRLDHGNSRLSAGFDHGVLFILARRRLVALRLASVQGIVTGLLGTSGLGVRRSCKVTIVALTDCELLLGLGSIYVYDLSNQDSALHDG